MSFQVLQKLSEKLNKKIVIFDLETTGLSKDKDFIVEYGYIVINKNEPIIIKNQLVKPEKSIEKAVSEIHGITNEMVSDKKKLKEYFEEDFKFFFEKDTILCGYNSNSFDIPFLEKELLRNGIEHKATTYIDVKEIWNKLSGIKKGKLGEVAEIYGIQVSGDLHRTEVDVWLTAMLLNDMILQHGLDIIQTFFKGETPTIKNPISKEHIENTNKNFEKISLNNRKEEVKEKIIEGDKKIILDLLTEGFKTKPDYILTDRDVNHLSSKTGISKFDVSQLIGRLYEEGLISEKNIANETVQEALKKVFFDAYEATEDKRKLKPLLESIKNIMKTKKEFENVINNVDYWQLKIAKKRLLN